MKKITISLVLLTVLFATSSCKSGKASCDAYGKVATTASSDQASK